MTVSPSLARAPACRSRRHGSVGPWWLRQTGGGTQPVAAQCGGDGTGLVVPVRDGEAVTRPAGLDRSGAPCWWWQPSRPRRSAWRIEGVLVLEPPLASGPYVLAHLLNGVDRLLFRVKACRAKKQDRLSVLVCTSCNSSRQDRRPRLVGRQDPFGLRLDLTRRMIAPRRLGRELHLLVKLFRPAAGTEPGRRMMTGGTLRSSRDDRWRRSTDNVEGIRILLYLPTFQTPAIPTRSDAVSTVASRKSAAGSSLPLPLGRCHLGPDTLRTAPPQWQREDPACRDPDRRDGVLLGPHGGAAMNRATSGRPKIADRPDRPVHSRLTRIAGSDQSPASRRCSDVPTDANAASGTVCDGDVLVRVRCRGS